MDSIINLKTNKANIEDKISKMLFVFESNYGVEVGEVNLHKEVYKNIDGSTQTVSINCEVVVKL